MSKRKNRTIIDILVNCKLREDEDFYYVDLPFHAFSNKCDLEISWEESDE